MNYILQVSLYVLRIPEQVSRFTRGVLRTTYDALRGVDLGLIFAALITLFIIQNFLQPGLPAAADFAIHLYRTMEFEQALAPGVIVPRWAPNLALGYGYPLFVFAPPLPYFLGLVFHLLGLTFESALKVLIILTIPLYAIGMYLLVRDVLDSVEAGLISAVAYAFAPFALREALLYGGNIPQLIAVGLFPWVLWALTGAVCRQSWGWTVASSLFYAGVLLSHLFQALVFTPVVGLYGLVLFLAARKRTPNFRAPHPAESQLSGIPASRPSDHPFALAPYLPLLIIPLGLLLSAFSWLPAFFERFATRAQANIYLEKSPFFVRYPYWPELAAWIEPLDARAANPYVPLSLGLVTLALAGFGLLAGFRLLVGRQLPAVGDRSGVTRRLSSVFLGRLSAVGRPVPSASGSGIQHLPLTHFQIFFFAIVAALAIFMTLPVSRWVWELVSILQVAEFPWRMLGLANLGLAFLAGAAVILLPQKIRPPVTAGCVLLQIVAVAPLLYPVTPFARYGQATIADQIRYEQSSQTIGTTTLGEYLPRTVTRPPTSSPLIEAFLAGQSPQRLDASTLPDGTQATLLEQNGVTHIYQLNTPAAFTLRFFQFDYLGWRAWLDDLPAKIRPESATGLILIDIPAGAHILKIHFGETPLRVVSISLTVLALGLIVLVGRWLNKTGTGLPTRRRRSSVLPVTAGRPVSEK